jgi:hypothetical protein
MRNCGGLFAPGRNIRKTWRVPASRRNGVGLCSWVCTVVHMCVVACLLQFVTQMIHRIASQCTVWFISKILSSHGLWVKKARNL